MSWTNWSVHPVGLDGNDAVIVMAAEPSKLIPLIARGVVSVAALPVMFPVIFDPANDVIHAGSAYKELVLTKELVGWNHTLEALQRHISDAGGTAFVW
jgi:hypothetical protein